MFLVNFLASQYRRIVEPVQPGPQQNALPVQLEPQQNALEKRIYPQVLKYIYTEFLTTDDAVNLSRCGRSLRNRILPPRSTLEMRIYPIVLKCIGNEFLTHANRANLSACSRSLGGFVETLPKQKEFAKILPLISGRCRVIPIQNSEPGKKGKPLVFNAFDYDPRGQCVLTGDKGDYDHVSVKLWNRRGEMVKKLAGGWDDFFKPINSVSLDVERSRAMASSSSSDGSVRLWDLRTGEVLFEKKPLGQELDMSAANFESNTLLCGSYGGGVKFIDLAHPDDPKRSPLLPEHHPWRLGWLCDAPEIDRIFSLGDGLKIWDRTQKSCLVTHSDVTGGDRHKYYDAVTKQLYVRAEKSYVRVIDGVTGKTVKEFRDATPGVELTSIHYDPMKNWVFAGFSYPFQKHNGHGFIDWARTKVVAWDAESRKLLHSFLTLGRDDLCYPVSQIDFDPNTDTVLVAGYGVQLWDLSGKLMLDRFSGGNSSFRWDKQNRLLVVFTDAHTPQPLRLVDYAPSHQ